MQLGQNEPESWLITWNVGRMYEIDPLTLEAIALFSRKRKGDRVKSITKLMLEDSV